MGCKGCQWEEAGYRAVGGREGRREGGRNIGKGGDKCKPEEGESGRRVGDLRARREGGREEGREGLPSKRIPAAVLGCAGAGSPGIQEGGREGGREGIREEGLLAACRLDSRCSRVESQEEEGGSLKGGGREGGREGRGEWEGD